MTYGNSAQKLNSEDLLKRLRWQPIPDSSQEQAVHTHADQTLYCGTRGCGKTAAQLMCFRNGVGRGWGDAWTGVIFDTEYKPLVNIIAQSKKFYANLGDGAVWRNAKADQFWSWPSGEKLYFRAASDLNDARNYLGHEYAFIGYNELSKWPTSEVYDHLMGTLRAASMDRDGIKPRVFSTTNPYGPGTGWIKRRFIDVAEYGELKEKIFEVRRYDGEIEQVPKTQIALLGNYTENPFFRPSDVANLMEGVRDRPELQAAWLFCDWDASYVDGLVGDLWDRRVHIVPNFTIPSSWKVNRTFDWGSRTPFAVGWFAEANDEEVRMPDGTCKSFPNGSIVMIDELYGSYKGEIGTNRGVKLPPKQVAKNILRREKEFVTNRVVSSGQRIYPGPADNQISAVSRTDVDTIEAEMSKVGVRWKRSDKSPGSRIQGAQLLRQGLSNALDSEGPGFYVMRKCQATITTLPSLQRSGEDVAKGQEDHLYDAIRYRLSQRKLGAPNVQLKYK